MESNFDGIRSPTSTAIPDCLRVIGASTRVQFPKVFPVAGKWLPLRMRKWYVFWPKMRKASDYAGPRLLTSMLADFLTINNDDADAAFRPRSAQARSARSG